jgi:allantoicase
MFYSDTRHVRYPGIAKSMADSWETARRRTAGNDYLFGTLAGPARLSFVTVDTGYFLGNARPGANLRSIDRQRAVARDSCRTADLAGFPEPIPPAG